MNVAVFICDTPAAMLEQEAELPNGSEVLYKTPDARSESGDIVRYLVKPPRSPGATLDKFAEKYLLIARL